MIRLAAVRARVEALVPALVGRLGNAADFSHIVDTNQIPQITPAGFVMFGGLVGREPDVVAGLFRQNFGETVSVVLINRVAGDPLADRALEDISPMIEDVVLAVCGWAPDDAIGVFQLLQAELVGAKDGALVFQIDFALNDQLRITTP